MSDGPAGHALLVVAAYGTCPVQARIEPSAAAGSCRHAILEACSSRESPPVHSSSCKSGQKVDLLREEPSDPATAGKPNRSSRAPAHVTCGLASPVARDLNSASCALRAVAHHAEQLLMEPCQTMPTPRCCLTAGKPSHLHAPAPPTCRTKQDCPAANQAFQVSHRAAGLV